jgi:CubicO group peptidase (beta-lactamase class C family)
VTTARELDTTLATIDSWGADYAAAAVVGPDRVIARRGDPDRRFRWASITKMVTAMAVLTAVDDSSIDLDEPAGPPGSTIRHLLAHASGLAFDGDSVLAAPGRRRIYSNPGFDALGAFLADRDGRPFAVALVDRVLAPLGMADTELLERPSQGLHGTLADAETLAGELLRPSLLRPATFELATTVAFAGLKGRLPGVGTFDPLDWGLGFEVRDAKRPHWMGTANSAAAFGHFGGAGTFVWVDPAIDRALVCLTDRPYGSWALEAWPPFSDAIVEATTDAQTGDGSGSSDGSGVIAG